MMRDAIPIIASCAQHATTESRDRDMRRAGTFFDSFLPSCFPAHFHDSRITSHGGHCYRVSFCSCFFQRKRIPHLRRRRLHTIARADVSLPQVLQATTLQILQFEDTLAGAPAAKRAQHTTAGADTPSPGRDTASPSKADDKKPKMQDNRSLIGSRRSASPTASSFKGHAVPADQGSQAEEQVHLMCLSTFLATGRQKLIDRRLDKRGTRPRDFFKEKPQSLKGNIGSHSGAQPSSSDSSLSALHLQPDGRAQVSRSAPSGPSAAEAARASPSSRAAGTSRSPPPRPTARRQPSSARSGSRVAGWRVRLL
ncbi:unnamed protein product [Mycena citricolor]|uniref:Uncharacterized protein n=1 Tax=Mycena citricolor TaxID=2018698 RepID=A0AAD2HPL4_9AGAR|nr:unnamed protein product [Mycena citricolor]CAK5279667.1 unnamed protein product [Mycena citricolor]